MSDGAPLEGYTKPLMGLIRLPRQAGTLLLFAPCWWGLSLGVMGSTQEMTANIAWGYLHLFILFLLGSFFMRSAGCIINDMVDRRLDGQVARTASRPLANGTLSIPVACVYLAVVLLCALAVGLHLPIHAFLLALAAVILVALYPFMKRLTWYPQVFLGCTFSWGVWVGASIYGTVVAPSVWLVYASGVVWTTVYDTLYACQDKQDDHRVGIKSMALLWGDKTKFFAMAGYSLQATLLGGAGLLLVITRRDWWNVRPYIWLCLWVGGVALFLLRQLVYIKGLDLDSPPHLARVLNHHAFWGLMLGAFMTIMAVMVML